MYVTDFGSVPDASPKRVSCNLEIYLIQMGLACHSTQWSLQISQGIPATEMHTSAKLSDTNRKCISYFSRSILNTGREHSSDDLSGNAHELFKSRYV